MDLFDLYNLTEKEKIKVYDWYIKNCNGMYINYDKINAIALNYSKIETYIEEKCILAEELGHYYYYATYSIFCKDIVQIAKQEYRAKKWSCYILIPIQELKLAVLKRNQYNFYSLAEYFEVTIECMEDAINFYKGKYGVIC